MYTTNMVYPEWKIKYSISPGTYVNNILRYCDTKTSIAIGFYGNHKSYDEIKQIRNILIHALNLCAWSLDSPLKLNDYIHCKQHFLLLMSWIGAKRIFKVITQKAFILLFTNTQTGNTKFQFQQQLIFM